MRGQGSTEYLVIFAAVLVVALIAIFLLSQFTGFGNKALVDQSLSYWRGVTPIAVVAVQPGATSLTVTVKNMEARNINLIGLDAQTIGARWSGSIVLAPGAETTQTLNAGSTICGAGDTGKLVETQFIINYTRPPGTTVYQFVGTTPLRTVCP